MVIEEFFLLLLLLSFVGANLYKYDLWMKFLIMKSILILRRWRNATRGAKTKTTVLADIIY